MIYATRVVRIHAALAFQGPKRARHFFEPGQSGPCRPAQHLYNILPLPSSVRKPVRRFCLSSNHFDDDMKRVAEQVLVGGMAAELGAGSDMAPSPQAFPPGICAT